MNTYKYARKQDSESIHTHVESTQQFFLQEHEYRIYGMRNRLISINTELKL